MTGEPIVTLCGSAGGDAELKFLPSGAALAEFSLAVTPRVKRGDEWADGETVWYRCTAWPQLAEQVSESVVKGMRLLVHGRLKVRTFQDKQGAQRTSLEVDVEHVGAEMRYAVVKAVRADRAHREQQQGYTAGYSGSDDPWGKPPPAPVGAAGADDEPPF